MSLYKKIVGLWKSVSCNKDASSCRLKSSDKGFSLYQNESLMGEVEWSEVKSVEAFKRDALTSDIVCLVIGLGDNTIFEINEEVENFWDVVQQIKEVFPESNQDWENKVIKPAFSQNLTTIYKDNKQGQSPEKEDDKNLPEEP